MKATALTDALRREMLIADGAMGTELARLGAPRSDCPEALCLSPSGLDVVRRVHEGYRDAGARILETNTFGASRFKLDHHGLAAETDAINRRAVEVCREVAGPDRFVAGSVGPLDLGPADKDMPDAQLREAYKAQMDALVAAGVDLLMLETFSSVKESAAALAQAAVYGVPVFFSAGGQTLTRATGRRRLVELVTLAAKHGAAAVGLNCLPPYELTELLPALAEATDLPLIARPNAGRPNVDRGVVFYDLPLASLLAEARRWAAAGVRVFGGCCGTTPEHIRALSVELSRVAPTPRPRAAPRVTVAAAPGPKPAAPPPPNPLRDLFRADGFLVAVEMRAEANVPMRETVRQAGALAQAGVSLFDVPDNPGGNVGRDCMVAAAMLQQGTGVPALIHKSATQSNVMHLYSYLMGCWDLGVRGVLAITGDPPGVGPFDRVASRVLDVKSSVDFLELLALLRSGEMINGQILREPLDFVSGCAYAPGLNLSAQTRWLARKVEAGAEFVFTQPFFAEEDFRRALDAFHTAAKPGVRLLPGLFPLYSSRQAQMLRSGKIPGIVIPDAVAEALGRFPAPADQAKCGLEIAQRLAVQMAGAGGIYLIPPFCKERVEWLVSILRALPPALRRPVELTSGIRP